MNYNRRLKVLHVGKFYPPHMGGIETHLQALCKGLKKLVDVKVVVANGAHNSYKEFYDGIPVARVGTLCNISSSSICPDMARIIRQNEADIIHIHLPNPSGILAYFASGHKGRLVITYHSDIVRQKVLGAVFKPFLYKTLNRCSRIIITSPNYIESSEILRKYKDLCRVIPYGIDVDRFQYYDNQMVANIRSAYGARCIISIGRLTYYKGFEYLIKAMAEVDAHLLIVGDGPLMSRLKKLMKSNNVQDRVTFLGEIQNDELVAYLHASEMLILPSIARSEAFGIVQLEAMACGKPVVNTKLDSGVPYVSVDGVTGYTVPPENPEALAEAINSLLNDPVQRERFGHVGKARVEREFNVEKMVEDTLDIYHEIML